MYIYIGIEDVAANALIELLSISNNKREVSFRRLNAYGNSVIKMLNKKDEQALLIMSNEKTREFFHDYSDYFVVAKVEELEGIKLKDDVTLENLWMRFRTYLSADVLKAFMNEESIKTLEVQVG